MPDDDDSDFNGGSFNKIIRTSFIDFKSNGSIELPLATDIIAMVVFNVIAFTRIVSGEYLAG